MSIIPISIEAGQPLLVGSKTGVNIEVQEVEVKEFENDTFPTGGFGKGYIEPVVSFAGEMTKSSGTSSEGRYLGSYILGGVGSDSLYISVYEYDNTDLPYGLAEEGEPQTKGKVLSAYRGMTTFEKMIKYNKIMS